MKRLLIGAGVALGLVGCGSSSSSKPRNVTPTPTKTAAGAKVFSAPGMSIHFHYPANFNVIPLAASRHVAGHNANGTHAAVGLGSYDLLAISRFPGLAVSVTKANLPQLKPSFDSLMSQAFGRKLVGTVGDANGLPAVFFPRVPAPGLPVAATSRPANVFVGNVEYEVQCQATPHYLAAIEAACNELFATLSSTSQ